MGMRGLESDCAGSVQSSKAFALADGLGAGLELLEGLQGASMRGRFNSGGRSIKGRAEMFTGF